MTRPAPLIPRIAAPLLALAALLLAVPDAHAGPGWRWPVEGELLTAYRNGGDPYAAGQHRGIDIAAPAGTPVEAATDGTVAFAGTAGDSGVTISIRTADGRFDTSYLHLAQASVRRGEEVSAGDRIGSVGTTGRRSVAEPHLHFGVREAGSRHAYLDPLTLLPPPAAPSERPAPPRAVPVTVPRPLTPAPSLAAAAAAGAAPALAPGAAPAPAFEPGAAPAPAAAPRPVPVPAAAPGPGATPAGAPSPASTLALRPATGPDDAPRSLPAPARGVAPAAGRTVPLAAASPAAAARGPALGAASPAPADGRARASAPEGSSTQRVGTRAGGPPALGAAPRRGETAATLERRTVPRASSARGTGRSGGLDLAWLAACAGMVAAAMMLGRPRGPIAALRGGRHLADARSDGVEAQRPASSIAA